MVVFAQDGLAALDDLLAVLLRVAGEGAVVARLGEDRDLRLGHADAAELDLKAVQGERVARGLRLGACDLRHRPQPVQESGRAGRPSARTRPSRWIGLKSPNTPTVAVGQVAVRREPLSNLVRRPSQTSSPAG